MLTTLLAGLTRACGRDLFAEEYYDILDTLPYDLKRNFDLMTEADSELTSARSRLQASVADYLALSLPASRKTHHLPALIKQATDIVRQSQDKRSLAITMQSYVQRHGLRLDRNIVAMEERALIGLAPGTRPSQAAAHLEPTPLVPLQGSMPMQEAAPRSRKSDKKKKKNAGGRARAVDSPYAKPSSPEQALSEPKYCFCNSIAFGKMVACDNPRCPREWFHVRCINVRTNEVSGAAVKPLQATC
jgi:hypothetical protein